MKGVYSLEKIKKFYENGGHKVGSNYIYLKYLLDADDERIFDRKIYSLIKEQKAILTFDGVEFKNENQN